MRTPITPTIIRVVLLLAPLGSGVHWAAAGTPATEPLTNKGVVAPDEFGRAASPARLKPYVAFAWSPTARLPHVSEMLVFNGNPVRMAFATKNMADGCRVILGFSLCDGLVNDPADRCMNARGELLGLPGIWPETGIARVSQRCQRLFSAFAFARGKCDLLVLDYEQGWSHWGMSREQFEAIEQDPRFPPIGKRLGFDDPAERAFNWRAHPDDAATWESVSAGLLYNAVNRAVGTPLWKDLPDAGLSNYESVMIAKANAVPDLNGNVAYYAGKPVGTCQSPALYGAVGNIRITGFVGDWASPVTVLVWSVDTVRASVRSSGVPIVPWVAYRSYPGDSPGRPVPWAGTDYWQENVFHAMLSSAGNNMLFWNPHAPRGIRPAGAKQQGSSPEDEQAMDVALGDLAAQARGSPLTTPLLVNNIDYGSSVLVSAARTQAGRVVARVTFAPDTSTADVKVDERVYHVTKPEGKVGAWLEGP